MTAISTGTDTSRLTPSEVEELHFRLATAASLNDTNIPTESIISDILSGRDEPVPMYTQNGGSTTGQDVEIRKRIAAGDRQTWDSIYSVIKTGNIEALDHFIKLGLDINLPHPWSWDFPIIVAVKAGQTNMMRHLINLGADVNVWSPRPRRHGYPVKLDDRCETSRTPLMCAAEQGSLNICKILCETAFADPMLIAPDGQTAQRLAARNGHKEIVQYLPAHRGGVWLRLKYDYNHRWRFIRGACTGIYWFFRIALYEIPIHVPYYLLIELGKGAIRTVKGIPPLKTWPGILKRAAVAIAKGSKEFVIGLGKVIKATPKAVYEVGKYSVKQFWKGMKAVPGLIKTGAKKTWNGIKAVGSWLENLFISIVSAIHTIFSAIADFFRSITLADIINGINRVLHALFVEFPQLIWSGLKAGVHGIHVTLVGFFGVLYWIVYYIGYALLYIVTYVPKKVGIICMNIAGGIAKAFRELWTFIYPKSMA